VRQHRNRGTQRAHGASRVELLRWPCVYSVGRGHQLAFGLVASVLTGNTHRTLDGRCRSSPYGEEDSSSAEASTILCLLLSTSPTHALLGDMTDVQPV
jgi:hypothetical protein